MHTLRLVVDSVVRHKLSDQERNQCKPDADLDNLRARNKKAKESPGKQCQNGHNGIQSDRNVRQGRFAGCIRRLAASERIQNRNGKSDARDKVGRCKRRNGRI